MWRPKQMSIPTPEEALPGREEAIAIPSGHFVHGRPFCGQQPDGVEEVMVGLGCFWGAERAFWSLPGVFSTAVGYAAGHTPNPTYDEVCSGLTGHNEVVRIWYQPERITLEQLLTVFWEAHNPTQGMRQGNDVGTQYRSGIYWSGTAVQVDAYTQAAETTRLAYQERLNDAGYTHDITTEIAADTPFYLAEEYHQQYLAKNPAGYCGLGGCGVPFKSL